MECHFIQGYYDESGNTLFGKEKVMGIAVSKKIILRVFGDMKGPITTDFLKICGTLNNAFYCKLLKQNSPHLLNDPCMYIFVIIVQEFFPHSYVF